MAFNTSTKQSLMYVGLPELVAHRLSDFSRKYDAVKDLTWAEIRDIVYGNARSYDINGKVTSLGDDNVAKAQIIYYLISPRNRTNPADNMPDTPPTFGIFNWWGGEDYEEPNRILREWRRFNLFNTQELRGMLKYLNRNESGERSVMMARLLKEELESNIV